MIFRNRIGLVSTGAVVMFLVTLACAVATAHAEADDDDPVWSPLACAGYVWKKADKQDRRNGLFRTINALASVGETRHALRFADSLSHARSKASAYLDILDHLATPKEKKAVLFRLFNLLVPAGPFTPVEAGDEGVDAALIVSSLAITGRGFALVGLPRFARVSFELSEQRVDFLPNPPYLPLSLIAVGYSLLGDESNYERLLGLALGAVEQASERMPRGVMLEGVAGAAAPWGMAEHVDRIIEIDEKRLRAKEEELDGYGASLYANTYIRLKAVDKALAMARRCETTEPRVDDLCDIADIMLDNEDEAGARKLAAEMEPALLSDDGFLRSRIEATARFALLLARLGELVTARIHLLKAEEWLAVPTLKQRYRDKAQSDVAVAWCRIGECPRAFELLASVDDDEDVVVALLDIFVDTYKRKYEFSGDELDAMVKLCPGVDL